MRRLPYLNGIRAFEATARHGSFAAAAEELHVTAAAVSRMVKLLEQRLGTPLFNRAPNRLVPTSAGRAYHVGLGPILDALVLLTEQVSQQGKPAVLTVGVGPTFAIRWLIPRLVKFRDISPDVEVRITTGGVAAPFSDDWSCGIKMGGGRWPGVVCDRLFAADLLPVCSPAYGRQLKSPRQLREDQLIQVAHSPEDWPKWLRAAKLSRVSAHGPTFEYYGQALQAACDGVGIALGLRPYIDDDLRAGRLIAPFELTVPKGSEWYLIWREAKAGDAAFQAFRQWIVSTARMV